MARGVKRLWREEGLGGGGKKCSGILFNGTGGGEGRSDNGLFFVRKKGRGPE